MSRITPGLPGAVVRPSREVYVDSDGRPRRGINLTLSVEQFEQYRQGYRCIVCHAAQEEAFPKECLEPYCRFPMKDKQLERLQFEDQGEVNLWPDEEEDEETRSPGGVWLP